MSLEHTWRWFGPEDPIKLDEIKQTGATGIVTSLHHIPYGELWPVDEILKRKLIIEKAGLRWSVVESLPLHGDIKKRSGNYKFYIENYKQSLKNLGQCGIHCVCYNFMPVLDWSRTNLEMSFPDGSVASGFTKKAMAAFELFILKLSGEGSNYTFEEIEAAEKFFKSLSARAVSNLKKTILLSLPGSNKSFTLGQLKKAIEEYKGISGLKLKENLKFFLKEIIPVAEQEGIRMAIHPDDPPFPVLGLPRIVSTSNDLKEIIETVDSLFNGITLCTGSLGAGAFNRLTEIVKTFAHRINFTHLRNVTRDHEGNFHENYIFEGDIDLYDVIKILVLEEQKRKQQGRKDWQIPLRPDHGHKILEDFKRKFYPGYTLYGRMKNLAELRGMEIAIRRSLNFNN